MISHCLADEPERAAGSLINLHTLLFAFEPASFVSHWEEGSLESVMRPKLGDWSPAKTHDVVVVLIHGH